VVHLAVIALAVRASGLTAAPSPPVTSPILVYRPPANPTPPRTPQPPSPTRNAPNTSTLRPAIPDLPIPITPDIPTKIPEARAMQGLIDHAFDPTPRVSASGQPSGPPNVADGSPLTKDLVEIAVVAIPGTATPRYPSMLQSAGMEGSVRAQFVVDTLGRVEQGSFRALESAHELFTAAVRDALGRARFKPAELGGRRVRQLVEQSFSFTISR
jgi:protein TonB